MSGGKALLTAGLVALMSSASRADVPPASEDYVLHCSACHGLEGTGAPGVVPTLHGLGTLLALPGGRSYLARVPGVAQAPLSNARLARLLNWALQEYSKIRPDPLYSAEEVGELRASPLRDPRTIRAKIVTAP